jgi:hypothetical protein
MNFFIKNTNRLIRVIFTIALLSLTMVVSAQDGFGDPGDDVPVDGGLTLLVAAGIGYSMKKMRENKYYHKK